MRISRGNQVVTYGLLTLALLPVLLALWERAQGRGHSPTANLTLVLQVLNLLVLAAVLWLFYRARVVVPLESLSQSIQALAGGQREVGLGYQKDPSEIGDLARSMEQYRVAAVEAESRRWVATSVAALAEDLQGVDQPEEFGLRVLSRLVPLLGGGSGAFHLLHEKDGRYHFTSGYCFDRDRHGDRGFAPGGGLAGQAAIERKIILLSEVPPDYLSIRSGLGQAQPRILVVIPLITEGRVPAILEIASLSALTVDRMSLLQEAAVRIAPKLDVLLRNQRTTELLGQVKASDERTRLILDSTGEGIFGVDIEGRIDFVNTAACRLLGFTAEEMRGQLSHQLIHSRRPDGSEYPVEQCPMFAAYKRGKQSLVDDEFLWRKDGTGLSVEYRAKPILKGGALVGAVISFTDISERKRQEQELKRINFLADSALDLTKSGYWHVPLDGSGWYNSSERAMNIFGDLPSPGYRYRVDEWAGHVREGDETAARVTMENFAAAVAGEIPVYDATYAYRRPVDGQVAWIHALGHVVKDADGKPVDIFGVSQDVTQTKLAEFALQASERRLRETEHFYRSVLEQAPDGLMVVDSEGCIVLANAQIGRLFQYEPNELIGQPIEVLVPPDVRSRHPKLVQSYFREPKVRAMGSGLELSGARKDGTLFPLEIALSPLAEQPGKTLQVAVSVREVTERRFVAGSNAGLGRPLGQGSL